MVTETAAPRAPSSTPFEPKDTAMATANQVEANRKNAKKSTGPKTDKGKKTSSQNALKHGLAASAESLMPGEVPGAFEKVLETWVRDAKPQNVIEHALVKRACAANRKLERSARYEEAVIARKRRHAAADFTVSEWQNAVRVGAKLWNDPVNRTLPFPYGDEKREKWMAEAIDRDPEILVTELERTVHGVLWLVDRWKELHATLDLENFWHWPEKFLACRLLKRWPEDVMNDTLVRRIFLCCHVLHPEPWEFANDVIQVIRWEYNHPSYETRINMHLEARPETVEAAFYEIDALMLAELNRLAALLEVRRREFEADRAEAADRASLDAAETSRVLRYEAAHHRELHRSLTTLAKLRKDGTIAPSNYTPDVPESEQPVQTQPEPEPAPIGPAETAPKSKPQKPLRPRNPRTPKSPNEPNPVPQFATEGLGMSHTLPSKSSPPGPIV